MPSDSTWDIVSRVIRERRSNLNVDKERVIADSIVDDLIDLAIWAPNHYRTNPFRVVVITGAARERVGHVAANAVAAQGANEAGVERQRSQFLRAPVVLAVASAHNEDPVKEIENRYAVSAGIENLLIGAAARGLAGAWRSGAAMIDPNVAGPVKDALGLAASDTIIGYVYLGYPIDAAGVRPAPTAQVTRLNA